jgi:hypothetical protein
MDSLEQFIAHARKKNVDHQTIRMLLLSAGWKEKDIARAIGASTLEMPIPLPPDAGGARDAFFHLLTFAAFYTTIISLVILFFSYINRLFPDPAVEQFAMSDDLSGIRWSIAAVLVACPLFFLLSRLLLREMQRNVEKASSGVRRWLTYLTLFVAATALMGDVITLVFTVLEGELSVRFLLKVAVVFALAGLTFSYYFLALRLPSAVAKSSGVHRGFGSAALAIVAVAIVWGMVLTGSPAQERLRKFDERRVEDLRAIVDEMLNIAYDGKRGMIPVVEALPVPLPRTLEDVALRAQFQKLRIVDPETGSSYGYIIDDATHFRLCATFAGVRDEAWDIHWNHPGGEHCFAFDALKPDLR